MNLKEDESKPTILSPLMLNNARETHSSLDDQKLQCIKCEEIFEFSRQKDDYLGHLYLAHRLVIADVDDIADLREYLKYWIAPFKENEFEEFCTTMLLDQLPDGTPSKNEKYYLLSDIIPQDYELRTNLHKKRLENALAQHQFERTDRNFTKECLHCRDIITGLRSDFLEHLFNKHFLQLGKPENLVYVDELIDIVQNKLENLICLYCEKIFKDRSTLKEHMRKKGHKRINPNIKLYDKFFLVNYKTEKPKHVKNFKQTYRKSNFNQNLQRPVHSPESTIEIKRRDSLSEKLVANSDDEDSDWGEWEDENLSLTCLFCSLKDSDFFNLKKHILEKHQVDFDKETSSLNFYQKIKVVNYIRRQMHILHCVICDERLESSEKLLDHMKENNHFGIGTKGQWDKPEFFFPTYEDDGILCLLDDDNNEDLSGDASIPIFSEDHKGAINRDAENLSLENFSIDS